MMALIVSQSRIEATSGADWTPQNLSREIFRIITKAKVARMECECWPSAWLDVIETLSGSHQHRATFSTKNDSLLDWFFIYASKLRKADWDKLTVEDLELILRWLLAGGHDTEDFVYQKHIQSKPK